MAFPPPFGVIGRAEIRASLAGAPRWDSVTMRERVVGHPDVTTLVIGYREEGRRAGAPAYLAYCTSTYRHDGRAWRLVQHQQTPAQ